MRARRAIVRWMIVGASAAVILGAWALPTFAGRAFIEVNGRIVSLGGGSVPGRSVTLPDGSVADGAHLRAVIEVTNHYPIPVTIDFRGSAFRASLIDRATADGRPVWQASADDVLLEQADESPDGGASPRVIRLPPGSTVVTQDRMALDLSATSAVRPGIYALEVSAYGIGGAPQLVSIVNDVGSGG